MGLFDGLRRVSLDGEAEWLDTEPLSLAGLRGSVVLVDFWTLSCINWLRTAPYVTAWARAYRDDGLVVVGVHTPEFTFERDVDLVRRAVADHGIDHAVAVDNRYAIWNAFDNHFWPARYLLDREGEVRDTQYGEGSYGRSERNLQKLLGIDRDLCAVEGVGIEAAADWQHLRSPETYLGHWRGERFASPDGPARDQVRQYQLPARLRLNHWALAGEWTIAGENVVLAGAAGSVAFRFQARDVHIVLAPGATAPTGFRVLLDGEAPGPAHGLDVDGDGHGMLRDGRLHQLVRQPDEVRRRTVEITFDGPGVRAHAFTFG